MNRALESLEQTLKQWNVFDGKRLKIKTTTASTPIWMNIYSLFISSLHVSWSMDWHFKCRDIIPVQSSTLKWKWTSQTRVAVGRPIRSFTTEILLLLAHCISAIKMSHCIRIIKLVCVISVDKILPTLWDCIIEISILSYYQAIFMSENWLEQDTLSS